MTIPAAPGEPTIRLEAVTKVFPGSSEVAVDALSLDIPDGEIVMLVGPSGCGKTTTLKMINRLVEPTSGSIRVEGRDVLAGPAWELRRSIGYVIQQIGLFPHRTIAQNIATVPELLGWDQPRIERRVSELLELMHLDRALASRFPPELSGGQRQRVGVARALAADPPVLLMDEPFGAVDPLVRAQLQDQLLELQAEVGKTIVFVTHDIDEALRLGDRVAILKDRGIVAQYDTPAAILADPADDFVAAFLGGERGLRRLALVPVRDLELPRGPVVDKADGVGIALEVMADEDTDWIGVLDGDQILGWVWRDELDGRVRVEEVEPRPFRTTVQADSSLRAALDAIVTTHNNVAVVCDGARFIGMLTVAQVGGELTR